MKQFRLTIAACLLICSTDLMVTAQNLTAKEVRQKAIDVTRVKGTEAINTLTIISPKGDKRVRKMTSVTKLVDNGDTEKKLIRFVEPADVKGTGFLTYDYNTEDDDKWIYMPALRKTRRIITSENAKSFMGSEFSYADMSMPTVDDFNYKFHDDETINGTNCYVIEIIPKDDDIMDENGFSKKMVWISTDKFLIQKSVYYNLAGDKEKVMTVNAFIEVDPRNHLYKFKEMEMVNLLENRKSISRIEQIKFNPDIPDDYFTTRYLER
jgi:outer membrane lipoprotein-sorting protein